MLTSGDRLVTFDSTHTALRAEAILDEAGIAMLIIPTPRALTASCGLAILHRAADAEQLLAKLRAGGVELGRLYRIITESGEKRYEPVTDQ